MHHFEQSIHAANFDFSPVKSQHLLLFSIISEQFDFFKTIHHLLRWEIAAAVPCLCTSWWYLRVPLASRSPHLSFPQFPDVLFKEVSDSQSYFQAPASKLRGLPLALFFSGDLFPNNFTYLTRPPYCCSHQHVLEGLSINLNLNFWSIFCCHHYLCSPSKVW